MKNNHMFLNFTGTTCVLFKKVNEAGCFGKTQSNLPCPFRAEVCVTLVNTYFALKQVMDWPLRLLAMIN